MEPLRKLLQSGEIQDFAVRYFQLSFKLKGLELCEKMKPVNAAESAAMHTGMEIQKYTGQKRDMAEVLRIRNDILNRSQSS